MHIINIKEMGPRPNNTASSGKSTATKSASSFKGIDDFLEKANVNPQELEAKNINTDDKDKAIKEKYFDLLGVFMMNLYLLNGELRVPLAVRGELTGHSASRSFRRPTIGQPADQPTGQPIN